jgi:allophanate hydrolase subunit 1
MSAVYPSTMPGGWHLIGRTSLRVFDASDAGSPSLLLPGDFVRFDVEDR